MAGSLFGADVERLRDLGTQFDTEAGRLDEARDAIDSLMSTVGWAGPDGESFTSDWHMMLRAWLVSAGESLRDAAATVRANADAQEVASRGDGGAGSMRATAARAVGAEAADGELPPGPGNPAPSPFLDWLTKPQADSDGRPSPDSILREYQVEDVSDDDVLT